MLANGRADNHKHIFNDHFLLVGPKEGFALKAISHPATTEEVIQSFAKIPSFKNERQTVFISRDDESASNVKEKTIFEKAGINIPPENNSWYYRMPASAPRFPSDCLKLALETKSFCIVDRATFLMNKESQEQFTIYLQGGEALDDILLNPCHALVSSKDNGLKQTAIEFVEFMAGKEGQKIISTFGEDKENNLLKLPFYTPVSDYL